MANHRSTTLTTCCTLKGAVTTLSFDPAEVVGQLATTLEKKVLKNGVTLRWTDESGTPQILIRVVEINQGNQFLRYLLPFISPAYVEVEGQIAASGGDSRTFHYVQKAQVGLFGGSARGMLRVCADRVGTKIARDILKAIKR